MRLKALTLTGILLVGGLGIGTTGTVRAQVTGTEESHATPLALPIHGKTPSAVVARLARQALKAPADSTTWAALAAALPELALTGDADLEGTFEAARMADSISAAAVTVPADRGATPRSAGNQAVEATRLEGLRAWTAALPALPVNPTDAALVSLLVLSLVLGALVFKRTHRAPASRPTSPKGVLWTATAMASGGVAVPDISRRTGLAQDAVSMVLRMSSDGITSRVPSGASATARRARSDGTLPDTAHARLRSEVRRGVGRLRDQRLTYGGGVTHGTR